MLSLTASILRRLLTAAVLLLSISQSPAQDTFAARFENDAQGTWLVYPTIPGWHYKIEGSPTPAAAGFTYVPGSFRYGNGQDRRWWIAPPPPPAIAPAPLPPPRVWRDLNVTIYVATDPGVHMVEVFRVYGDHS